MTEAHPDAATVRECLSELLDEVRCEAVSFSEARHAAPWSLRVPSQHETRGYLLEEGLAVLEAGGGRLELEAGDLAVVLQDHPHRLSGAGDRAGVLGQAVFRLDRLRAAPLLRLLPPVILLKGEAGRLSRWVQPLASIIFDLREDSDPGSRAIVRRMAEASLIRAAQEHLFGQAGLGSAALNPEFCRIAPVLRAIHRAPGSDWTIAALAREAGMSRTVFAEVFVNAMGEAPGQYLTKLRLSTARDFLRARSLSIAEVASRVGYQTEAAFSRAFKRQYGLPPGGFRRAGTAR